MVHRAYIRVIVKCAKANENELRIVDMSRKKSAAAIAAKLRSRLVRDSVGAEFIVSTD